MSIAVSPAPTFPGPHENRGPSPDFRSVIPAKAGIQPVWDLLSHFATKYVWWKTADEALRLPDRVIAACRKADVRMKVSSLRVAPTHSLHPPPIVAAH